MSEETLEQRKKRFAENRAKIVSEIKAFNPKAKVSETELTYYTARVVKSKIEVVSNTCSISGNATTGNLIKNKFLTKEDAENAILKLMPEAQSKFEECLNAYKKLMKDLKFSTGFNYDGDTYGIYNEYDYISFDIGTFHFQFMIEW